MGNNSPMRPLLACALAILLLPLQLPARAKKAKSNSDTIHSAGLKLYVLEGKDAVNFIPDRKGTTPVVEVRDDNDLPVENVNVEYRLPESGPGGEFEDGKHIKTVLSNTAGQTQAPFTVNDKPGSFSIQVTAKIDTRLGTTVIPQSNSLKALEGGVGARNHRWYKDWRVLTIAGAAVAVTAVLLATRKSSSSSSSTTVVLTPGGPVFGAPH